jgi:hypothetical protein
VVILHRVGWGLLAVLGVTRCHFPDEGSASPSRACLLPHVRLSPRSALRRSKHASALFGVGLPQSVTDPRGAGSRSTSVGDARRAEREFKALAAWHLIAERARATLRHAGGGVEGNPRSYPPFVRAIQGRVPSGDRRCGGSGTAGPSPAACADTVWGATVWRCTTWPARTPTGVRDRGSARCRPSLCQAAGGFGSPPVSDRESCAMNRGGCAPHLTGTPSVASVRGRLGAESRAESGAESVAESGKYATPLRRDWRRHRPCASADIGTLFTGRR